MPLHCYTSVYRVYRLSDNDLQRHSFFGVPQVYHESIEDHVSDWLHANSKNLVNSFCSSYYKHTVNVAYVVGNLNAEASRPKQVCARIRVPQNLL